MINICIVFKFKLSSESTCGMAIINISNSLSLFVFMSAQKKYKRYYDSILFISSLTLYTSRYKKTRRKLLEALKPTLNDYTTLKL